MPLISFLERQRAQARERHEFLDSLDSTRTVLLADLMTDPAAAADLGIAAWFDREQFVMRIRSMCGFFDSPDFTPQRSYPLVFLQSACKEEDQRHHEGLLTQPHYARRFGHVDPGVHYFITETSFMEVMLGDEDYRNRVIRPTFSFSNWTWRGLYRTDPGYPVHSSLVLGYRVPDFAELLGVPGWVATDYLARIIVHDLGHAILPDVAEEREPLHDVAMVYAMDAPRGDYENAWQALVHRECTDPYFVLEAHLLFRAARAFARTPEQRFYLHRLRKHYAKAWAPQMRILLWNLPSKRRGQRGRRHIESVIDEMRGTHFARYAA